MEDVISEMSSGLYNSVRLRDGQIEIIDEVQLARAYLMALQLYEYECVDFELLEYQIRRFIRERGYNED